MIGLLALLAAPVAGYAGQRYAEARDRRRFPMPGRLVDVDGTPLHVVVSGHGPTVLLDSGLGGSSLEWSAVARELEDDFTVVRYDRPGFGWSPPTSGDVSPLAAAGRIHALLQALQLPLPAILVGHSLGGLHVRLVAALHPEAVAGLVLVDPSDEEMLSGADAARAAAISAKVMSVVGKAAPLGAARLTGRLFARMVAGQIRRPLDDEARAMLACSTRLTACSVDGSRASVRELVALPEALRQVKQLCSKHPLPAVPLTIISADAPARTPAEQKGRATIRALHEAQAAAAPLGRVVLAADSGHLVPVDEPDLIARCVRETAAATPTMVEQ